MIFSNVLNFGVINKSNNVFNPGYAFFWHSVQNGLWIPTILFNFNKSYYLSLSLFFAFKYIFLRRDPQVEPDSGRSPWHKNRLRTPDVDLKGSDFLCCNGIGVPIGV
jgi:hypothetical protein